MLNEKIVPQGFDANALKDFLDSLAKASYRIHGLMVVRNDELCYACAAKPYTLSSLHRLFSSAKSILVLVLLHALQNGKLSVMDKVVSFFPEIPVSDPLVREMTVRDLLTMQTGQEDDPFGALFSDFDANLITRFLATPCVEKPGTRFRYNNTVPHMICAVTERAVGMPVELYFREHIMKAVGAPVYAPTSRDGIYNPVVTTMSMESFLKYALLFLHKGWHNGKQLIRKDLMEEAMAAHTFTGEPFNVAYGYQIWHNAFGGVRMDGGWGQFAFILPEENACVVILSDMTDPSECVKAFEKHLLPALRNGATSKTEAVRLPLPSIRPIGSATPRNAIFGVKWRLENGMTLCLEKGNDELLLQIDEHLLHIGIDTPFLPNKRTFTSYIPSIDHMCYAEDPDTVLLSGAWATENELVIVGKSLGEMGEMMHKLLFEENKVTVSFQPTAMHGIADGKENRLIVGYPV